MPQEFLAFLQASDGRKDWRSSFDSILLAKRFGQGAGRPNSGSPVGTDVHIPGTEARWVALPNPVSVGLPSSGNTDRQERA